MMGVVSTDEAMRMAREVGMDLVEVSPNERPPVCKIMDYGKHKYQLAKRQKQRHHERKTKEIRLRPKTEPHDRDIKLNRAKQFLEEGARVQFTMMFRGRERFHADMGQETFQSIIDGLADVAKVESYARLQGRRMTMVLVPAKAPKPGEVKRPPKAVSSPTAARADDQPSRAAELADQLTGVAEERPPQPRAAAPQMLGTRSEAGPAPA